MTIKAILDTKGRNVVTIDPNATLSHAILLLSQRKIGALLIVQDGRVAGILSERDVVRAFADQGAAALDVTVDAVMTRNVTTCGHHDSICDIMEHMTQGKFRHMPVMEDGKLAGVISIGDVVKHRIDQIEHESQAMRDYIQTA